MSKGYRVGGNTSHGQNILLEEWRTLLINQILLPNFLKSLKRLAPVFRDAARVYSIPNSGASKALRSTTTMFTPSHFCPA